MRFSFNVAQDNVHKRYILNTEGYTLDETFGTLGCLRFILFLLEWSDFSSFNIFMKNIDKYYCYRVCEIYFYDNNKAQKFINEYLEPLLITNKLLTKSW